MGGCSYGSDLAELDGMKEDEDESILSSDAVMEEEQNEY